jgi:hypothetical protein
MASFKDFYREVFQTFGYPLTERTALSSEVLAEAEVRLGLRVPAALREYYLVAGRERRFNSCCDRLLPPSEWTVDKQRLVFMEENQAICVWGVSIRDPRSDDPPVFERIGEEPPSWSQVQRKCSHFLAAMLHHQAVSDGFPHCCWKFIDESNAASIKFNAKKWRSYGELKGQTMFSRANQVFCFSAENMLPMRRGWVISAGGKTKRDLEAIKAEIGLEAR